MENDPQRERLMEKMFEAALKEKFSQLGRKYNWELVFKIWAEIASCEGVKFYFKKWVWKPQMTITEALGCLDRYCDSIEAMIRERVKKEEGEKSSFYKLPASVV